MGIYRIDLIISGKNQIAGAMNGAVSSVQSGVNKIKSSATGANNTLQNTGSVGRSAFMQISYGASTASSAMSRAGSMGAGMGSNIRQGARYATEGLSQVGHEGARAGEEVSKGSETGTHSLTRMGEAGRSAGRGVAQGSAVASQGLQSVTKNAETATHGLSGMQDLLTAALAGYGAYEIGTAVWSGATERQFNQAYLAMKLGNEEAEKMAYNIEEIVADVPGDDTFMNTLLGSAAARGAAIGDLHELGYVAADYLLASKKTGQTMIEAQQDLNSYIMTGTTGELERSRVLAGQVDKLEDKKTIHERILALDEALKANGWEGLSKMDIMVIKWETFKGKIQVAATTFGSRFLPYLEKGVDYLLELDEKTGGLSTQIGLASAGVVALGLALGPVVWSAKEVLGSVTGITDKLTGLGKKKHKVDFDCGAPCPPVSGGGGTGTTTTGGKSGGKSSGLLPVVGKSLAGILGGATIGDVVSNYVLGPSFEGISGLLGGSKPFKSYHGILDLFGFGNTDYEVLNYNQQISKNAEKYGLSGDKSKQNLSDWGPLGGVFNWYKDNWGTMMNPLGAQKGEGFSLKGRLDGLLGGGTSHAADGTSKPSIGEDILGSKGILRGTPLAGIKWPSPTQILTSIKNTLVPKIPKLNWKLPTIGSIGNFIKDKIPGLGWKIPSLGSVGGWVQDKINWAIWQIPSLGSVGQWVTDKITWLSWQIPSLQSVLDAITSRIPSFSWPWGPGGGTVAATTASNIGSRASALLNARGPAGPINNTIVSTMSARSGVGSDFISRALANRFSGLAGFTPIADGMAAPLAYEFYMGGQKTNQQVWDSGTCNCYDGAEFLQAEAGAKFGLGAGLANGVWNGTAIPHTWSVIGGQPFDMAAKLLRGHWPPPSGPLAAFDKLMMDIGPGLEYIGYPGHMKDPISALTSGGNCFDMSLGVMNMASTYGLPSELVWGTYQGNSHVWPRVAGHDYDPSRMALAHTYNPPPWGPPSTGNGEEVHVHIHYDKDVYGFEDFESKTIALVNKGLELKTEKRRRKRSFGG